MTAPDSAEFEIVTDKIRHLVLKKRKARGRRSDLQVGQWMVGSRGLQRPKPILLRARTSGLGCGLHLQPAETEVPPPEIARGSTFKFGRRRADECIDTPLLAMGYFKSSDFLRLGEEGGQACRQASARRIKNHRWKAKRREAKVRPTKQAFK